MMLNTMKLVGMESARDILRFKLSLHSPAPDDFEQGRQAGMSDAVQLLTDLLEYEINGGAISDFMQALEEKNKWSDRP